jgi:hypothetical protein
LTVEGSLYSDFVAEIYFNQKEINMLKKVNRFLAFFIFILLFNFFHSPVVEANTNAHQFQLNGGFGVLAGSNGLGASFDFGVEPEYFITEHNSLAFRFDLTAGGLDSADFALRYRYYFDIPSAPRFNIFLGLGFGGIVNFNGGGLGDAAIPVFGFQYDLMKHFKIGSDFSFDIVFNSNNTAFAARLMPVVLKWAF